MTRSPIEVVRTNPGVSPAQVESSGSRITIVAAAVTLATLTASVWVADRRFNDFLSSLDDEILVQATRGLDHLLKRQRDQLVGEVTVLADDNRIRSTVLAATFDVATIQDVIDDLRKSSGATLLAVIDGNGKVQVVSGASALRDGDLGASSAVKEAFLRPTSDVWTLPDQVQVVALAPIRSRDQVPALLVKGMALGKSQLATVERTLGVGVSGAVFVGDKIAASSSLSPDLDDAFRIASRLVDGTQQIATAHGHYLVRVARTSEAATGARVAWLVPLHHQADRARPLVLLIWCPVVLGAFMFSLLILNSRRVTNGGRP
jgi:hypothetical protein